MPFLVALVLALTALPVHAARGTSALSFSEYIHTAWTQHDGVPIGRIRKLLQTSDGYLWVLTRDEGLLRFDGMRFVRPPTPCKAIVSRAAAAADGGFWAICGTQLIRRTRSGDFVEVPQTFLPPHPPPPLWMHVDRAGRPWFFFGDTVRYLEPDGTGGRQMPRPTADRVRAAALDADGTLWVSDMEQVVHVFPDHNESLDMGPVWCLAPARDDGVFALTANRAWRLRKGAKPAPIDGVAGISLTGADSCLAESADGGLWVGTDQRGLALLRDGRLETRADTGAIGRSIEAVFIDRDGTIWAGANAALHRFRKPVARLMASTVSHLGSGPGFIFVDSRDNLWLSPDTDEGVSRSSAKDGTWASVRSRGHEFWAIGEDETGRIWLSNTRDVGYVANGTFVVVRDAANEPIRSVNALRADSRGHLWGIASGIGLYQLTPGPPRLVLRSTEAASDFLVSDRFGIWFARANESGVAQHVDGRTHLFPYPHDTRVMVEDGDALWFGTDGGLKRWRHGVWTTWTREHGLPEGGIGPVIMADRQGRFWIMTAAGLLMVPRAQLDATPDGAPRRLSFAQIGTIDGVIPPPSASASSPHAGVDRHGRLYFATLDSIITVDPAAITESSLAPPIALESVTVDNQPIDVQTTASFVEPSRLRFDFTSLDLRSPESARFRYRLDGYDADWIDAGVQRQVTYGTLRPGSYRFHVIGAGGEGVWNEEGAAFAFQIVPVYWRTWWFRIAVLASAALLVAALYRLRVQQLTRRFTVALDARVTERTRIARELHDTLLQSFQGVLIHFQVAANLLPERPEDAKRKLETVLGQGARAITEARDAVKELRAPGGATDDLPGAIGILGEALARESQGARGSSATVRVHVEGTPRRLRPIVRDDLYRIASEAVRNAVRHAEATEVQVDVHYDERRLRVRVRDDGKGIDPKVLDDRAAVGHWGLPGMRERAELIGGTLDVRSRLGAGTEIDLSVPAFTAYAAPVAGRRFWSRKTENSASV